uniref:Uncharacterized protein n=1 Tax=Rhizophora mucronata TaxID=61149 RepID=A0A2P2QXL2_RHIMU
MLCMPRFISVFLFLFFPNLMACIAMFIF